VDPFARLTFQLVGMSTKVVTLIKWKAEMLMDGTGIQQEYWYLGLQQIGGQTSTAIAIVKCKGRREARHRYSQQDCLGHYTTERRNGLLDGSLEKGINQQVWQGRVLDKCLCNLSQKHTV
jgi:hypothetical protein